MSSTYALLLTLALSPLASAQAVDCKLARSPRDHALCSDKNLIALNTSIAASLQSLHDQLSPQSAALVDADQREWSQWVDLVCPAHAKGPLADQTRCLFTQYSARARDLNQTTHVGAAVIYTRAHFLYKPGDQPNQPSSNPTYLGFGYGSLRWPQIDSKSALTPTDTTWNETIQRQAAKLGAGAFNAGENVTFDTAVNSLEAIEGGYTLDAANGRLIEVTLLTSSYVWVPSASILTIRSSFLWWLDRNRQLIAADVFLPASAWQEYLVSVATARLQENARLKSLLRPDAQLEQALRQAVPQPTNWTLSQNGLTLTFLQGAVAANSAGQPHVFVSWEDLKPFLQPTLDPATLPPRLPKPAQ